MTTKVVKVAVDPGVWYPFRELSRERGELRRNVEEALQLYLAVAAGEKPENLCTAQLPELEEWGGETMYVRLRISPEVWEIFRAGLARGEVSEAFNEALKLYLGSRWGTLAVKEEWVVGVRAELRRSIVNLAYERFEDNVRYLPLEGEFEKPVLRVVTARLGEPAAILAYPDLEPVDEGVEEAFENGRILVFRVGDRQLALSKTFLGPSSISV